MSVKALQLFFYILLISTIPCYSQITMRGTIKGNNEALPFVHITIFAKNDSVNPVVSALTDLSGSYKVENLNPGKYLVKISYIGYEELNSSISIRMPSGSNSVIRDFELIETSNMLQEVCITANRNDIFADHTKYRFSSNQIAQARHAADLLENVSDLTMDPISGNITKLSGGNVTILINGINATTNDLKSIPSNKIRFAEYYTIPSARYSTATAVINVVTKNLDNGINGGFDLSHATNTGFFNDNLYVRMIRGKNQVTLNYRINYRNYKNRFVNDNYKYLINSGSTFYQSFAHNKFGYTTHIPNVKYLYSNLNSFSLQISFTPEVENKFDSSISDISYIEDNENSIGIGTKHQKSHYFCPSIDIYAIKNLGNNSELAANIVGTYYKGDLNSVIDENFENDNITSFSDRMYRKTSREYLIGELFYTKKIGFNTLSLGYRGSFNRSTAKGQNILSEYTSSIYNTKSSSNYIYGEYSGIYSKLMYRLSIGGTLINSFNKDNKYRNFYITPQAVLDWKLKENNHISLHIKSAPTIPLLSQLSNNAEYLTSKLVHAGNPKLKSGIGYNTILGYRHINNLMDITIGVTYNIDIDPIEMFYSTITIDGSDYILAKEDNAKRMIQYGGLLSGKLNLFSNKLSLRIVTMALEQNLKSKNGLFIRNLYIPTFCQLSYTDKNWGINYKFNIPSKQISGAKLITDENTSSLNAYYQYRNIRLSASCQWFLTKAKYKEEVLDNNLITHNSTSWINDNKSMIIIGLSWNFSTGKKNDFTKQLNNSEFDKGTF